MGDAYDRANNIFLDEWNNIKNITKIKGSSIGQIFSGKKV